MRENPGFPRTARKSRIHFVFPEKSRIQIENAETYFVKDERLPQKPRNQRESEYAAGRSYAYSLSIAAQEGGSCQQDPLARYGGSKEQTSHHSLDYTHALTG
jgi:hypothetical protein